VCGETGVDFQVTVFGERAVEFQGILCGRFVDFQVILRGLTDVDFQGIACGETDV